jgi:hypothetical protein
MRSNGAVGTCLEDSIRLRQYRLNVLATIKHSDNLGRAVYDAIEYDMRLGGH